MDLSDPMEREYIVSIGIQKAAGAAANALVSFLAGPKAVAFLHALGLQVSLDPVTASVVISTGLKIACDFLGTRFSFLRFLAPVHPKA